MGTEILKGPYIHTYLHTGRSNSAFTFNLLIGLLKFCKDSSSYVCTTYMDHTEYLPQRVFSLLEVILVWSLGLGLIELIRVDDPLGCILWFYPHGYIILLLLNFFSQINMPWWNAYSRVCNFLNWFLIHNSLDICKKYSYPSLSKMFWHLGKKS
jgi:hypothetical protein